MRQSKKETVAFVVRLKCSTRPFAPVGLMRAFFLSAATEYKFRGEIKKSQRVTSYKCYEETGLVTKKKKLIYIEIENE